MLERTFTVLLSAVLTLSCSAVSFAQKKGNIIGAWVRVSQSESSIAESAFESINEDDYLKLHFQKGERLKIYGNYAANGIETAYKYKKGKITYGFDRVFEVESYSDSTLVLTEWETAKANESLVRHYYLREKVFLDRIAVGNSDWFVNGADTVYFSSKNCILNSKPLNTLTSTYMFTMLPKKFVILAPIICWQAFQLNLTG